MLPTKALASRPKTLLNGLKHQDGEASFDDSPT